VILETTVPMSVYLYTLLGIAGLGLGEFWLVRRVRRSG